MESILRDVRFGLRMMAASPGTAALAIAAVALAICANTVVFSVVDTVLLRGLPVEQPERLVQFAHFNAQRNVTSPPTPYPDVPEWRRHFTSFEAISAMHQQAMSLGLRDETERVLVGRVNANFFAMLGVRPAMGRDFAAEEDRPGAGRAAVLTDELWRRRFGSSEGALGQPVTLEGENYTVIGVLPRGFRFTGQRADLYVPLAANEARGTGRPAIVTVFARLKPAANTAQLQAELDAMTKATIARFPPYRIWKLTAGPLDEYIVPDVKVSLWVLLGAVGLVLLLACANVANLLLARAAARRRELAIRAAMGAGRLAIIRQLMLEALPVALLGTAAGLLLAFWGVALLRQVDLARVPRLAETVIDARVLLFTAGISVLNFLLFAVAPALAMARSDLQGALSEGGRSGGSAQAGRIRAALVVSEVAIAVMLAAGATLMVRTFLNLSGIDPGFRHSNILTAQLDLPPTRYNKPEQIAQFHEQLIRSLRDRHGVRNASATTSLPLGGNYFRGDFKVYGRSYSGMGDVVAIRGVDRQYIPLLGVAVVRGRAFDERDREGGPKSVMLNQTTARRLLGDADPIGQQLSNGPGWMTVIGVVADVRHEDVTKANESEVLLPLEQNPARSLSLMVQLDPSMYPEPSRFVPELRAALQSVDKNLAAYKTLAFDRIVADRLAPKRVSMWVLTGFAGLAILLAAAGIYGVLAYAVEQRRHEIGVRIALGAGRWLVLRSVLRQAFLLAAAGAVLGVAGALASTRLLETALYGVRAADPVTYVSIALLLTAVAVIASYIPARRAAAVDPVVALRDA